MGGIKCGEQGMLTQWSQRDNPNDCSYKKAIFIHAKEGPITQQRDDSMSSEAERWGVGLGVL